jgi:hypothetical protein
VSVRGHTKPTQQAGCVQSASDIAGEETPVPHLASRLAWHAVAATVRRGMRGRVLRRAMWVSLDNCSGGADVIAARASRRIPGPIEKTAETAHLRFSLPESARNIEHAKGRLPDQVSRTGARPCKLLSRQASWCQA